MIAILRIQFSSPLKRIGQCTQHGAGGRRISSQLACRQWRIKFTLAGDGTFTANVQSRQRAQLSGIGYAHHDTELLLHTGIGSCGFHAPEFQRRTIVLIQLGVQR